MMQAFVYVPVYGLAQGAGGKLGPHLTIIYSESATGDIDAWDEACDLVAQRLADAKATYTGQIESFGHDEKVPVALVQSGSLHGLRRALLAFLAEQGASAQMTFETFRPHVTLKPDATIEPGPVTLGPLCLRLMNGQEVIHQFCWGDDVSLAALSAEERTPTQEMADAARAALEARSEKPPSERGMTRVGLARARQLINRQPLSPSTIRRMASFFARHEDDKNGQSWNEKGKGWQAWHGWGGDAGRDWAERLVGKLNRDISAQQRLSVGDECSVEATRPVPEGFVVGQPFRFAGVGEIFDRHTGERIGLPFTRELLADAVRFFHVSGDEVPIDREHREGSPGGLAVGMALVDGGDAVAVLPAYNATRPALCGPCKAGVCTIDEHEPLAAYVDRLGGVLWSSPRVQWGRFYSPQTGQYVGRLRFPNIALTTEPATSHRLLDQVRLAEAATNPEGSPMHTESIIARYVAAGMPEQVLATMRDQFAAMPDATPEELESAAAAVLAQLVVQMDAASEPATEAAATEDDDDFEMLSEPATEAAASEDDDDFEMLSEPATEAAASEDDDDFEMLSEPAAEAAATEDDDDFEMLSEGARLSIQKMIETAVEQRFGQAQADAPTIKSAPAAPPEPAKSNSQPWDMTTGDAEVRFGEGLARGTFDQNDRGVFMSYRRRIDAGGEGAEDARRMVLEHFGQVRRGVEARLSAPGHRVVERTGGDESAHDALRRLGKSHPRGTAGVLADWDRTGDDRLNSLN